MFLVALYGVAVVNNKDSGNLGTVLLGTGTFLSGLLVVPKQQ